MELSDLFQQLFPNKKEEDLRIEANLPRVTAAKKIKFLRAIGATDQLDGNTAEVNMDDENLDISRTKIFKLTDSVTPLMFDDTIVINAFEDIEQPEFDLKTYVACVKELYNGAFISSSKLSYLLCHARDFTTPRNKMFTFSEHGTKKLQSPTEDATLSIQEPCRFTAKLMSLMDDLLIKYSEAKYQQLNMNVTYLVLLMTRQIFKGKSNFINAMKKSKTHESYANLCPKAVSERLPDDAPFLDGEVLAQTEDPLFTMILYAYFNSSRLTRRVLVTTCISHMEYTGLGLPMMFDKVAQLYQVPEGRLWDALCVRENKSMFALADFHDAQRRGEDQVPPKTYSLFPYCRVFGQYYHCDLSCKNNELVCYAMSLLIDKKIGINKSHMRDAQWAKDMGPIHRRRGEALALQVLKEIDGK